MKSAQKTSKKTPADEENDKVSYARLQDDVPMTTMLRIASRQCEQFKKELEFVRQYANGLEEENLQLSKKLQKLREEYSPIEELKKENVVLQQKVTQMQHMMAAVYPKRLIKLSSWTKLVRAQRDYINYLEYILKQNSVTYRPSQVQRLSTVANMTDEDIENLLNGYKRYRDGAN